MEIWEHSLVIFKKKYFRYQIKSNLLNNKGLDASYKLLKHLMRYAGQFCAIIGLRTTRNHLMDGSSRHRAMLLKQLCPFDGPFSAK